MSGVSRRWILASGGAALTLSACGNPIGGGGAERLDARVDAARDFLRTNYPGTQELFDSAVGILYIPLVTEAGFGIGGAYGQGALRIDDISVDYYSATRASVGLQIGAQQYAHALFFMSREALSDFRRADGWAVSADMRYAVPDRGGSFGIESTTQVAPVIALVFGQSGLIAGASLAGVKYTRIIP